MVFDHQFQVIPCVVGRLCRQQLGHWLGPRMDFLEIAWIHVKEPMYWAFDYVSLSLSRVWETFRLMRQRRYASHEKTDSMKPVSVYIEAVPGRNQMSTDRYWSRVQIDATFDLSILWLLLRWHGFWVLLLFRFRDIWWSNIAGNYVRSFGLVRAGPNQLLVAFNEQFDIEILWQLAQQTPQNKTNHISFFRAVS